MSKDVDSMSNSLDKKCKGNHGLWCIMVREKQRRCCQSLTWAASYFLKLKVKQKESFKGDFKQTFREENKNGSIKGISKV